MNHSPAEILRQFLIDQELFAVVGSGYIWPVYVGREPDGRGLKTGGDCAILFDDSGVVNDRPLNGAESARHLAVTVQIRARGYRAAVRKLNDVAALFGRVWRACVSIDGSHYRIQGIYQTNLPAALGSEKEGRRRDWVEIVFRVVVEEVSAAFAFTLLSAPTSRVYHAPSEIIIQYLLDQGVVTSFDSGVAWAAFVSSIPDYKGMKANAVSIYDTDGLKDGRLMENGENIFHYGIQVLVRSGDYQDGYEKALAIRDALLAAYQESVTVERGEYRIENIRQTTPVFPLGNAGESRRRDFFTINFLVTLTLVAYYPLEALLLETGGELRLETGGPLLLESST